MRSFIISLLLLVEIPVYAQFKAAIIIKTNNADSYIFVDNQFKGRGEVSLKTGECVLHIKCIENLLEWNSRKIFDTLFVENSDTIVRNYNFGEKPILLDSAPQNAMVYSGNIMLGYSPLRIESENLSNLSIKKSNYATKTFSIEKSRLYKKINLELLNKKTKQHFVESDTFLYLMGSAAALGISAAYFKLKADKKYDNYLDNLDKSVLNETDRLDLYSGIATTILQVNLGYIVYRLVTD